MHGRIRVLLVAVSVASTWLGGVSSATATVAPIGRPVDLRSALAPDGTFVGASGVSGPIDTKKWQLESDLVSGEPPRLAAAGGTAGAPAPTWSALGSMPQGALNGTVYAVAVSGSDVYVGGSFTNAGGIPEADYIARWNGTAWSALGSNGPGNGAINDEVHAIAVSAGVVYVGGNFHDAGGNPGADYVARWDGTSWLALQSFCCGIAAINNLVRAIAVSGDNVYVGGPFTMVAGYSGVDYFARYSISCDCWSSVGGANVFNGSVDAIAVATGGDVYVGGVFHDIAGDSRNDYVSHWNGVGWFSLGSDGFSDGALKSFVNAVAVIGADIYVGGDFTNAAGPAGDYVARYNNGAWFTMGTGPDAVNGALNGPVYGLTASGSDLYVGGAFTNGNGQFMLDYAAIWHGASWDGLGSNPAGNNGILNDTVRAIAVANGKTYLGGAFTNAQDRSNADYVTATNGITASGLGSVAGNDGALNLAVWCMYVWGSRLYVGGPFTNAAGIPEADYVAMWDGTRWSALGSNGGPDGALNAPVAAFAGMGSYLYVGGRFTNAAGIAAADFLARWNNGWSAVPTPSGNAALNNYVSDLQTNGWELYIGGVFTDAAGNARADHIVRWNGLTWSALGSNQGNTDGAVNATVTSIGISGSDVYVGGTFNNAAGLATADYIARWTGSAWQALGSNGSGDGALSNPVYAVAIDGSKVYAGGDFLNAGGVPTADRVALWNGSSWSGLGSNGYGDGALPGSIAYSFQTIEVSGNNVYVGGLFPGVTGVSGTANLARFDGASWSAVGAVGGNSAVNSFVDDLVLWNGGLYVAGLFTDAAGLANADVIAQYGPVTVPTRPDGRIAKGSGTLVGNNIYNLTGANQTRKASVAAGSSVTFKISIQNDGASAVRYKVGASGAPTTAYTVHYFAGTTDITSLVEKGAWVTPSLAHGATFVIKATVKLGSAAAGSSTTRLVTTTAFDDPSVADAVKFVVKRS